MTKSTAFFPSLKRLLFGRKPLSGVQKVLRSQDDIDPLCVSQLTSLFGSFLPAHLLQFKAASGANSRSRVYSPTVTFWAFLGQVLDPGSSCRKAVSRVQTLFALTKKDPPATDTSAYCTARRRLPLLWLCRIRDALAARLCPSDTPRLLVLDGTSVTLSDTPELQKRYPQMGNQKPGCGFPILKLVGLFCLQSGAWLATAKSHRRIHDLPLSKRLHDHLRAGDTVVADRAWCSYFELVALLKLGVQVVVRRHQKRKTDFRKGKGLGHCDHLLVWKRPLRPRWMSVEEYQSTPRELTVRETQHQIQRAGWRDTQMILISTLLDVGTHSREAIARLYARRWQVELNFDDLKTTLGMDTLRGKSPAVVCRELVMHMIAYNLLRSLAERSGVERRELSFKGCLDRVNTWSWIIWSAPTAKQAREHVQTMLAHIATDKVPERPDRKEPRAVKRRPKSHQLLTKPRSEMQEIRHRSNYKKAA